MDNRKNVNQPQPADQQNQSSEQEEKTVQQWAENPDERANSNLRNDVFDKGSSANDVGSEITDGEDA